VTVLRNLTSRATSPIGVRQLRYDRVELVHDDGSVQCWGRENFRPTEDYGQLDPPGFLE